MGPRDLKNGSVEVARRDTKEKETLLISDLPNKVQHLLESIQENLFLSAKTYRDNHITPVNTWDEFKDVLENKTGFISAHWDGTGETEEKIKQETKATIRCIPFDAEEEAGSCVFSGNPSNKRVLFAKAY
jgi:prolyl-tRNA synthetase